MIYLRGWTLNLVTLVAMVSVLFLTGAVAAEVGAEPDNFPDMEHVEWSRNATIYEVNLRQFTQEGTINAFAQQLPRLKKLGVDILWLMPVQPIGKVKRKGPLGSYYSISDYTAVNPEFGSLDDFKKMVKAAHQLGMKVILDWVPNHTAWDHPWTSQHKNWYKLNAQGELYPATFSGDTVEVWEDVTQLNYAQPDMRKAMIAALLFWIRDTDIDGFRCDVASAVPVDFWEQARKELDAVKPVFMLAEADLKTLHHSAFDMTYGWDLADLMRRFSAGKADVQAFRDWITVPYNGFARSAYRMHFTNNHDFNTWDGTDAELYGAAYEPFIVLTFTLPGMPLIYGGQEARLTKRLEFFKRDPIQWDHYELAPLYTELVALKHRNPALANGQYGAQAEVLDSGNSAVLAYRRHLGSNRVTVAINLSGQTQSYHLPGADVLKLGAWRWQIDETR